MTEQDKRPALSDLVLDQYRLGELDGAAQEEVERTLATDSAAKERLEQLRREAENFAMSPKIPNLATATLERAQAPAWRRLLRAFELKPLTAVSALAGIAVLVIALPLLVREAARNDDGGTSIRLKGSEVTLHLRLRRGVRQWTYREGDLAQANDQLRFIVKSQVEGYLYIFGVQANGKLFTYEPEAPTSARRLTKNDQFVVPGAIELDDSPQNERLVALVCKTPRTSDDLKASVTAWAQNPDVQATHLPCPYASVLLKR